MAHALSQWTWATGLTLQCVLLGVIAARSLFRTLPFFSALLALYVLRSAYLFVVFGHLSAQAYSLSLNTLAVLDIAIQVMVAWELFQPVVNETKGTGSMRRRVLEFSLLVVLAAGLAWGISFVVPANLRAPIDRGVLFPNLLMVLVAGMMGLGRNYPLTSAARRMLGGFSVLGAMGVLSQIERTMAALHRQAAVYVRWSYADVFVYFVVLIFWIFALHGSADDYGAEAVIAR